MKTVISILSQQWLWGLFIGAALTYISQWLLKQRQQKDEQKIASMLVATLLRRWLADCVSTVYDHENWESSDGHMGKIINKIPDLNIEQSLDLVVRLKPCEAKATFELIQNMRDTERSAAFLADAVGGEEATDLLHEECGPLFIAGLDIYKQLAKNVKWEKTPFSESQIQKMTALADCSNRSGDEC